MLVRQFMKQPVITLSPAATMREAAVLFDQNRIDGAPVVDVAGKLVGLLTKSHIIKALAHNQEDSPVSQFMTVNVHTIPENTTLEDLERSILFKYGRYPVVDANNRLKGFITRTDLFAHLWERSVSQAEEMKAVLSSVSNGVIVTNADGVVTLFNKAAEIITGLKADFVVGQLVDDVIPNTRLRNVLETGLAELNQKQNIGNCQILTNRTPIYLGNTIIGAVAVFQDITQLQTVVAELEDVKNLSSTLETILDSIFDCIVVVDRNGHITMLNHAYQELLGVSIENVYGKHVTEVIENTRMHLVAQTGKAEICALWHVRGNDCVVTRKPIIKDGEIVGAVGKIVFRDVKDLKLLVKKISTLQSEVEYYKEELRKAHGGKYTIESIIGKSEKTAWLKTIALKAAKGDSTVLILGESGTGKEIFAHAIHNASPRRHGPFIKINCAALPENLLESELFGYDEGAFSGARKGGKPGKFELANGGTIFFDEIGDMTLAMQAKVLRVLQEKEFDRIGGTKTSKVDVRVIAATNRDIEAMVERGEFRQDLYYRLNIITLQLPPLRERKQDIPLLCEALLKRIDSRAQQIVEGVSPEAMRLLMEYDWPGNVRELENVLERAVNLIDDETHIMPEHLPPAIKKFSHNKAAEDNPKQLAGIVAETEKQAIYRALETTGGNKSKAAKLLGIQRSAFYQKLQKYGIQ
ncbi:MAG: sigma 54-interacting transcriptional regulator [Negativicutes bacterium]|nr:sigma 54-interacting transcriptional regulator [Negativicutes bacterium]